MIINSKSHKVSNSDFDIGEFADSPKRGVGSGGPDQALRSLFSSRVQPIIDPEMDENDLGFSKASCQYEIRGDGNMVVYYPTGQTTRILPAGVYGAGIDDNGRVFFKKKNIVVDDLIEFSSGEHRKILEEIEMFWQRGEIFQSHGFLHRRGYMLYGPPGGGKTCLVQLILAGIQNSGGVAFLCDGQPGALEAALSVFRVVEPTRPAVCVFEDIDAIVDKYGESSVLSLLDGETQIDKVLNLATTNYPEKLDKRLVARPRRFDRVIKVGMPNEAMRRQFFTKKLGLHSEEIEDWIEATEGFSFASMSELVISVKCLGNDFKTIVERMEKMARSLPNSKDDGPRMGFA
jgi:SpoVK/Ycf46/Vps4 family AAA+-type ATPase